MDEIWAKSKSFQLLTVARDPLYEYMVQATEIVKDFIIKNNLIVYGGTAIDYALRLHGDNIYPDDMLAVPDLDFFSPNNVEHAYALADILYNAGYESARAINALHLKTMKVDIVDNHWMADISYIPTEIFAKLPYIMYNGMRIIHPTFQRLDMHSALSFPYDNPPMEVFFERWSKDISRFNKMVQYYPLETPGECVPMRKASVPIAVKKYVFGGFLAYAIIYEYFCATLGAPAPNDIIKSTLTINDSITFNTLDQMTTLYHFDIDKCADELNIKNPQKYEPYINMLPMRIEGDNITILSTYNRLLAINSIDIQGVSFRVANVQPLFKYFLGMWFIHKDAQPKIAAVYIAHYQSLMKMIAALEPILREPPLKSPLFPSIDTYGNANINLSTEVLLSYLYSDLDDNDRLYIPRNYNPGRSLASKTPHPVFIPAESEFFRESGALIKN